MSGFAPTDHQALDNEVLEQALMWMVTLQSGVCTAADQHACQRWRDEHPQHELAWQRLLGLNRGIRGSTATLPAGDARRLLQARSAPSRRTLLKGFAGLGVATAMGLGVRERVLLPELFSDYSTATGERRQVLLADVAQLQLDTRTAVDFHPQQAAPRLVLSYGRLLMETGTGAQLKVQTLDGWVQPGAFSRLVISQGLPDQIGTRVQVLSGSAALQPLQGTSARLGGGQQADFAARQSAVAQMLMPGAEAWTRGLLIAERMPLAQLLRQLDRYRRGVLRCDTAVAQLQVSGSFSLDQPEASLDLLAKVLPIRVQRVFGYWATVVPA